MPRLLFDEATIGITSALERAVLPSGLHINHWPGLRVGRFCGSGTVRPHIFSSLACVRIFVMSPLQLPKAM